MNKINTKIGLKKLFNKKDVIGNALIIDKFLFQNNEMILFQDGWDLPTIYLNKDKSIEIELIPIFQNNVRLIDKINIYNYNYN